MSLQELIDLVVVVELNATLPKMLDPVETRILNFRRKTLFHLSALYLVYEHTRNV